MVIGDVSMSSGYTTPGVEAEPRAIRVLLIDDQSLIREGVAAVLERAGMRVVAAGGSGSEALALYRRHRPDVVLMELRTPGLEGAEIAAAIRGEFPGARIVMLTACDRAEDIHRALDAGACGYLLKTMTGEQLVETIRAVHAGRPTPLPPALSTRLAERPPAPALTRREVDILQRMADGGTNKEIASQLRITEGTVKGHVNSILLKLDARHRTHAVVLALSRGIVQIRSIHP